MASWPVWQPSMVAPSCPVVAPKEERASPFKVILLHFKLAKPILFKKADFTTLFQTGSKKHGSFFMVYFLSPSAETTYKRFGLVVGKKATGTNVKRNLVKRIIRESYRLQQHSLTQKQILIVAKRNLKTISAQDLRQDLDTILAKIYD